MSKNTHRSLMAGIGIGAGLIGIGATAGALFLAHKKAKEHDQTTAEYIKGKARNVVTKVLPKKSDFNICPCCGTVDGDCDCSERYFDDFEEDAIEFDTVDNIDLDLDDEDELSKALHEKAKALRERDEWKARYDELLKTIITEADSDKTESK